MKTTILFLTVLAFFSFKNQAQTVTDYDGNVYDTVKIGTQVWLKENLKVTHYRNGDLIPLVTDANAWSNLSTGAYCNYNNDTNNVVTYGRLYNWYAVSDIRNIAPTGWHIPTDVEWTILTDYLGGLTVAGGKLKETGTAHWTPPNTGATNESGFTGLAAGGRNYYGVFNVFGHNGGWWSATESDAAHAWSRYTYYLDAVVSKYDNTKTSGWSVRCIKDNVSGIGNINNLNKIKIFPNPAIEKLFIECVESQYIKLQVYNMNGVCVIQRNLSSGTNDIDISSLSKGVYVIKVNCNNWIVQEKLVKE